MPAMDDVVLHGIGVLGESAWICISIPLEFGIVRARDNAIEVAMFNWHGPIWDTRNVITLLVVRPVYMFAHEWMDGMDQSHM
jgi:hypothetical protein